jgi:hypothetical protein
VDLTVWDARGKAVFRARTLAGTRAHSQFNGLMTGMNESLPEMPHAKAAKE